MKDISVSFRFQSGDGDTPVTLAERIMHIYRYTSRAVSQVLEDDKGRKAGAEWLIVKFRGMAARTQSLRWAGAGEAGWLLLEPQEV